MNTLSALSLLGSPAHRSQPWQPLPGLYTPALPKWIAVRQRFDLFHRNLSLTSLQQQDAPTKRSGVIGCLNRHYYGTSSATDNSFMIGSWGKGTAIRPPRDIDLYFLLPVNVYHRYQLYRAYRQSAFLQEVKDVFASANPDTDMRCDGQVVVVRFETCDVEVAPDRSGGLGRLNPGLQPGNMFRLRKLEIFEAPVSIENCLYPAHCAFKVQIGVSGHPIRRTARSPAAFSTLVQGQIAPRLKRRVKIRALRDLRTERSVFRSRRAT